MNALNISNLSKTFPNGTQALRGIDLQVEEGDFFALLGPNGAGKSTAIGIISSLVNKSSGAVEIFGHDINTDMIAAKSCIGLVPQEFNFNMFEYTAEIVINQAGYYGIPRPLAEEKAEKYLRQLDLWQHRHSMARELSGGMKRRLMIARALVHEPKLLILDEPTAGVDIELRRSMWEFLKDINANGTTIILTTHYLEEAEQLCRNIAIIDHGNIIEHSSMRVLLEKLDSETYIFYLENDLEIAPVIQGYEITQVDTRTIEVCTPKNKTLNKVIAGLSEKNIHIISMRNKTNRLEEMFMNLVKKRGE
ncbi:MAG: ABC transporter ATP-binding protein [Gammaproteobacteria bacterium]|nr:ABC transporter ATP-binding protein [Gammaproteobacteria bacterium]